jgi:hypothetical protein
LYIDLFNVLIVLFILFSGALIFFLGGYTVHLLSKREVIRLEKPIEIAKLTDDEKRTNKIKKEDEEDEKRVSFF